MKTALVLASLAGALAAALPAHAQDTRVYRCGNEYTNDARATAAGGCRLLEGGQVTILQSRPPTPGIPGTQTGANAVATAPSPATRIDSTAQRSRDQQARQILGAELDKSLTRLRELQAQYQDGQPERQGNERNYQRYLDRVAQLKVDIERTQSDIDGLQREISRLPPAN
ncbi:MAG: hypothetical protein GAK30_01272 [Paracidovorax wautersii]|uniref:DUF4124 domain-containing protein n=1 Tax=Paracidovorax wautersii TaxID=1177982 RepID=A0A7V8JR87_9BURK|nr:MAG: hypothetical protein GAK30_01272 [Paracidovorax wautersii]